MVPTFMDRPHEREVLTWEHEGNKAVRKGRWKLVCKYPCDWELYDMEEGRTEVNDVSADHPNIVRELRGLYGKWANRCEVTSWQNLCKLRENRNAKR